MNAPLLKIDGGERRVIVHATGKASVSHFIPKMVFREASLMEVHLESGRTHQVRVHAASIGQAVIGDERYADPASNATWKKRGLNRMFLHAARLSFPHPQTGATLAVEAPLPLDLARVLENLGDNTI